MSIAFYAAWLVGLALAARLVLTGFKNYRQARAVKHRAVTDARHKAIWDSRPGA